MLGAIATMMISKLLFILDTVFAITSAANFGLRGGLIAWVAVSVHETRIACRAQANRLGKEPLKMDSNFVNF
jgi:hypothetical protein